ncbi:MAG: glycerol kinase, partial [Oceanospirillales bacterium]
MSKYLLAIDQGTTSSRAILFSKDGKIICTCQEEFPQHFPKDGWVEHNPEDIWQSVIKTCKDVLKLVDATYEDIIACGITNQR